ncbi:MAG: hypothetical protein HYS44_00510 [Candidatus Niyogibacteria bacterium]|nr:hypothetical protein [Candidatus Niyogibacteria bacterium]
MTLRRIFATFASITAPLFVFAAAPAILTTTIPNLLNAVIVVIIALAGLVFLWGVFKFVSAAGDEKARTTGRQFIIWGLVGLAVMFAFWGIVNILIDTFSLQKGSAGLTVPKVSR